MPDRHEGPRMTTDIVSLSQSNATLLDNIAPDVFDNAIDPRSLAAFLADPRHVMVVAVQDGVVVGMATAFEYVHPDKPPQMFVNEVGVTPAHQSRGIGRKLVEALLDTARARGCTFAWLGTATDNTAAQACFASVPGAAKPQTFLLYEWDLAT
jgi:ribosomal protein S18 acetylase RimI-like enzyme